MDAEAPNRVSLQCLACNVRAVIPWGSCNWVKMWSFQGPDDNVLLFEGHHRCLEVTVKEAAVFKQTEPPVGREYQMIMRTISYHHTVADEALALIGALK